MRASSHIADREGDAVPIGVLVDLLQSAQRAGAGATERAASFERLEGWLARGYVAPDDGRDEAKLIAAGRWLLNSHPDHPIVAVWATRAMQVLRTLDDLPLAVLIANFAFEYLIRAGNFPEAGDLASEMSDRAARSEEARLRWLPSAALFLWLSGRPDAALAALCPALEDRQAGPELRFALLEQAASAALASRDAAGCRRFLDAADDCEAGMTAQDRAHVWFLRAGAAALTADHGQAADAMARCQETAREVDSRFFVALWRLGTAYVRLKADQARRAERDASDLLGDVVLMRARFLEWSARLARAAARLALGRDAAAKADLAQALRIASTYGYVTCDPWGITPRIRRLLEHAVERGIERPTALAILAGHPA